MTTKEAIILAGGRGTRLGSLTENTPKPLLEVGGKPFLLYLIDYLSKQGIQRIVFSTGYKANAFTEILPQIKNVETVHCEESKPLGTGGGMRLALEKIHGNRFFALNGDTYFPVNLYNMEKAHTEEKALATLALKNLSNFDRYGTVELSGNHISKFNEKKPCAAGWINGGVYLVEKSLLLSKPLNENFSFEKDILEKRVGEGKIAYKEFEDYFIDLGVPEDFSRAQNDCAHW